MLKNQTHDLFLFNPFLKFLLTDLEVEIVSHNAIVSLLYTFDSPQPSFDRVCQNQPEVEIEFDCLNPVVNLIFFRDFGERSSEEF